MELKPIDKIKDCLPSKVINALAKTPENVLYNISEIRMRADNITTVTSGGENLYLADTGVSDNPARCIRVTHKDIDVFIYRLCGGSVYSYEDTIKKGYITRFGIRTGICGEVSLKGKEISGFNRITGVNVRIPNHISGCCENLICHISQNGFPDNSGILIVSPPGVGKTTVLRELAIRLSRGITQKQTGKTRVYRVTVIDERNEIFVPELFWGCMADVLSGAVKSEGIECASRVMSPEIIICDEIGSKADADMLADSHIGGVVFIASMHGNSADNVLSKPAVFKLCNDGVFSYIYLLERISGKTRGSLINIKEYMQK